MPDEISLIFKEFLAAPNKTDEKSKQVYLSVVSTMKTILSDIDKRIENIIFQK